MLAMVRTRGVDGVDGVGVAAADALAAARKGSRSYGEIPAAVAAATTASISRKV